MDMLRCVVYVLLDPILCNDTLRCSLLSSSENTDMFYSHSISCQRGFELVYAY